MSESAAHWVGVDLGATKVLATLFSGDFQPLGRERKKTRGHEGSKAVVERILRAVRQAMEQAGVGVGEIRGIGIGCPGPVDMERGIVLEAVNLKWEKVRLSKLVEQELGCPVQILNDVDAGVYGEYCFGAARSSRTVLGVFPGTGIGGGCVYSGEILHGAGISCMEIGHIPITSGGRLCGCGKHGCLETEASRLAIAAEVVAAAYRGEAPHILEEAGTNLANIRSGLLAAAIAKGDRVVEQIVRRAAGKLGEAIAGVVHLLAPDLVLLGGGLVEAMPRLYTEAVTEAARRRAIPAFAETFSVQAAKLGDDAAVLGAAAWAHKRIEGTAPRAEG